MSKNKEYLIYALIAVLVIGLCGGAGWFLATRQHMPKQEMNTTTETQFGATEAPGQNALDNYDADKDLGTTVKIDGQTWRYNRKLRTVLFMGVDSTERVVENNIIGNGGRADVIMLLILDEDTKQIQILQISRDTITKVEAYDRDRKFLYAGNMQINMQYAFSDGPTRSCMLMKKKVSELLYGISVDHYCSLTMDGIPIITDALGGITVTLDRDWTEIDPSYISGATITMDGAAAEMFIRYRDTNIRGSNETRMERQTWLLQQIVSRLKSLSAAEMTAILDAVDACMETDMDAETLMSLRSYDLLQEAIKVPGQVVAGERHDEYHVDEAALKSMIMELFYIRVDE